MISQGCCILGEIGETLSGGLDRMANWGFRGK